MWCVIGGFSPTDAVIASGSSDMTVRLWNIPVWGSEGLGARCLFCSLAARSPLQKQVVVDAVLRARGVPASRLPGAHENRALVLLLHLVQRLEVGPLGVLQWLAQRPWRGQRARGVGRLHGRNANTCPLGLEC